MRRTIVLMAMLLVPSFAQATNGLNMISYNAWTGGMGGADTALGFTALSIASNPAGITQYQNRFDFNISPMTLMFKMSDRVLMPGGGVMPINDGKSGVLLFPLPGIAYSRHIYEGLYAGIAFFAQGGIGAIYDDPGTMVDDDPTTPIAGNPAPATYEMKSQLMYMKIAPTLAYKREFLSLGASLHIGLSQMMWRHTGMQFPEMDGDGVYVPHALDFTSDFTLSFSGRFGILLQFLDDRLRFGLSYLIGNKPKYKGEMDLDGMLKYDLETDDFGWAHEVAIGAAVRLLKKRLLLSVDFRYLDWSSAVNVVTFDGKAKSALPPEMAQMAQLQLPFMMKWQDGYMVAGGAEYAIKPDFLFVRAGYNYSRPIANENGINPLFPPIAMHHITAGVGLHKFWKGLSIDFAMEYAIPNEVKSNDVNQMGFQPSMPGMTPQPSGYRVDVSMQQITAHLVASYDF